MASVSVLLLRPVIAALPSARLPELWRAADVTPELAGDHDARISPAQFCVAWAEAIRISGDPTLGLKLASVIPIGAFGIVEYVCRAAPTLGEALRQWVRYLNLLDDAVKVALIVEGERAYLRVVSESEAPAPASHELCFALVAKYARELSAARFRPLAVELSHRAPDGIDLAVYRNFFDAPVTFGTDTTQLVLPRAALAASLVSSDPSLLAILQRAADDAAKSLPADATLTEQVKRALRASLRNDDGGVDAIAKQLGLSSRSLQRRLKDEGVSFQTVREQVRRELAQRYIEAGLSTSEISFLLGFSEPSAFFRAFKRWTGLTPLDHRSQLRAQPA